MRDSAATKEVGVFKVSRDARLFGTSMKTHPRKQSSPHYEHEMGANALCFVAVLRCPRAVESGECIAAMAVRRNQHRWFHCQATKLANSVRVATPSRLRVNTDALSSTASLSEDHMRSDQKDQWYLTASVKYMTLAYPPTLL